MAALRDDYLGPAVAGLKRLAVLSPEDVARHQEAAQLRAVN